MLFQKEIQNKHWEERKTKESKNSEWINWQKILKILQIVHWTINYSVCAVKSVGISMVTKLT